MEKETAEVGRKYNELMMRTAKVFANESRYQMAQKYVKGLLGTAERKNGWQLAESRGEAKPYEIQQFLYRGRFSADELRDVLREYVGKSFVMKTVYW